MRILPLLFFLSLSAHAAEPACASRPLAPAFPAGNPLSQAVGVQFSIHDGQLQMHFEVRTAVIDAPRVIPAGHFPYEYDVIELFIAADAAHRPYYEIELSPYDNAETYNVLVDEQRKFHEGIPLAVQHAVQITAYGWKGELSIPLAIFGADVDPGKLTGNAYAIFGKNPRSYWSLFPLRNSTEPPLRKINFHKPEFFRPLLDCN